MRRPAFTIVELIIALSLLALVATLALPASIELLSREGNRSALFACESAIRSVRADAMRDGVLIEIGARAEGHRWQLVARPYSSGAPSDARIDVALDIWSEPDEEEARWNVIATLPQGFAFRFEPMPTMADALESGPEIEAPIGFAREVAPERVAIALPNGAIEGVGTWRLVTDTASATPKVERLSIARWTGGLSAVVERPADETMAEPAPERRSVRAPESVP